MQYEMCKLNDTKRSEKKRHHFLGIKKNGFFKEVKKNRKYRNHYFSKTQEK